jgi:tripartite-type tricarboxylate transporter receptor subunit TctC
MLGIGIHRSRTFKAALGILLIGIAGHAVAADQAASFPEHPINLIVPYPPGGANDIIARIVAPKMGSAIGTQIIIDNRPGAGGIIGTGMAARAQPDGYTILMINTLAHTSAAGVYPKLTYNPVKDFNSLGMIGVGAYILVVNNALPVKTVGEFIALAKRKPGNIPIASGGAGSASNLAGEFFMSVTKANLLKVYYRGGGPVISDLIAGHVQATVESVPEVSPMVKDGTLRGLAITSSRRSSLFPDVPTVAESGYPGFDVSGRFGLVAPAGTPAAVITKLNQALNKALAHPDVDKALAIQGADVAPSTPVAYDAVISEESKKWLKVVKDANIHVN